ncbi:MAG: hypothetical protein ACYT04_74395, partial [Nostoc sp.]
QRPTVPARADALVPKPPEEAQVLAFEQNPPQQPTPVTELASPTAVPADTLTELKVELEKYPETRRHSAIVLEKELDSQLTQFCKDRGITVETFLEAAWTVASSDNTTREKITVEAKRRYDQRKRVGQLKRLITMLSNTSK